MLSHSKNLVRFYDNDINNFIGLKDKIDCIEVSNDLYDPILSNTIIKKYLEELKKSHKTSHNFYYDEYIKKYPREKKHLDALNIANYGLYSIPNQGITDEQLKELTKWSRMNKNNGGIVFFDWDKTITIMDGFRLLSDDFFNYLHIHDNKKRKQIAISYMKYLLGGSKRFLKFKNLFKNLFKNNITFYIITNNDAVFYKYSLNNKNNIITIPAKKFEIKKLQNDFLKFVQIISIHFKIENLLFSRNYESTKLKSNKCKLIQQNYDILISNHLPDLSSLNLKQRIIIDKI
jgi:hypothetical protein